MRDLQRALQDRTGFVWILHDGPESVQTLSKATTITELLEERRSLFEHVDSSRTLPDHLEVRPQPSEQRSDTFRVALLRGQQECVLELACALLELGHGRT